MLVPKTLITKNAWEFSHEFLKPTSTQNKCTLESTSFSMSFICRGKDQKKIGKISRNRHSKNWCYYLHISLKRVY